MKTDITLLPCPFCGGEAEMDTRQGYLALGTGRLGNRIAAYCRSCNADMGVCIEDVPDIEPEQVADMWNRRAAGEADRQGRMPGDDDVATACKSLGWDLDAQEESDMILLVRTVMSRYSSGLPAASAEPNTHTDDDAVDRFAAAMKDKLAQARAKGRHGWQECDPSDLSQMLRGHVEKGDPRDVANFCCFLWSLGKPISAAPVAQEPVARVNDEGFIVETGIPLAPGTKLYTSAPVAAQAQPVAFAKDGVLFWHGEHAAWRGFNGDLYLAAQLTAQTQPAMPPLTEAMRAVLRNEHCVYDSEDALYAALCDAAQAQPDHFRGVTQMVPVQAQHPVGAGDGPHPDAAGCCGATVTQRCEGCPHDVQAQPVVNQSLTTDDDEMQPFYDAAWKAGAIPRKSFAGDDLDALSFSPAEFEEFCRAALAQQPSDDTPYPFLPDSLIIATRHQSGTTAYRAEMRDEQDRLTIGGSWHPTRQAATAEAWAIQCDLMRAQQASAQDQKCLTCGGRGWIGGPSYRQPDEGGEPCPECQGEQRP